MNNLNEVKKKDIELNEERKVLVKKIFDMIGKEGINHDTLDYYSKQLDWTYRELSFAIRFMRLCDNLGIDLEDTKNITWRKLGAIYSVLNKENWRDWFDRAKAMPLSDLVEEVKKEKEKNKDTTKKQRLVFIVDDDQAEIVRTALEEMKAKRGNCNNSSALVNICYEWYQTID